MYFLNLIPNASLLRLLFLSGFSGMRASSYILLWFLLPNWVDSLKQNNLYSVPGTYDVPDNRLILQQNSEEYTVNFLWVNGEKKPNQTYIFPNDTLTNLQNSLAQWHAHHPRASLQIFYYRTDFSMVNNTMQFIKNSLPFSVELFNLAEQPLVSENEQLFDLMPILFIIDFMKIYLLIILGLCSKQSLHVYTDIDMPIITPELMSREAMKDLIDYGFLHNLFENQQLLFYYNKRVFNALVDTVNIALTRAYDVIVCIHRFYKPFKDMFKSYSEVKNEFEDYKEFKILIKAAISMEILSSREENSSLENRFRKTHLAEKFYNELFMSVYHATVMTLSNLFFYLPLKKRKATLLIDTTRCNPGDIYTHEPLVNTPPKNLSRYNPLLHGYSPFGLFSLNGTIANNTSPCLYFSNRTRLGEKPRELPAGTLTHPLLFTTESRHDPEPLDENELLSWLDDNPSFFSRRPGLHPRHDDRSRKSQPPIHGKNSMNFCQNMPRSQNRVAHLTPIPDELNPKLNERKIISKK